MSELNSSLCQLTWLTAKNGFGSDGSSSSRESGDKLKVGKQSVGVAGGSGATADVVVVVADDIEVDETKKPPYSYSQLIRMSIEASPMKRCTLSEIYAFITDNFLFYRKNRNTSWKNSIRHNLSLNKQFKRLEKVEGDKGSYWICVDPPERKPKVFAGPPPRLNPAIERLFGKNKKLSPTNDSTSSSPTISNDHLMPTVSKQKSGGGGDNDDDANDEISDLNLFDSYDLLNSSFRDVYDQIFEKRAADRHQHAAQIDWLKISLEAAGLDYTDEQEMINVDTARFCDYINNGFPESDSNSSTPRKESVHKPSEAPVEQLVYTFPHRPNPQDDVDSEDEFDWNRLL